MADSKDDEVLYEKERWYSHTAALAIAIFFVGFGVPIWWQTTTVYRADLPYQKIKQAFQTTPMIKVDIEVVLDSKKLDTVAMAQFGESLQETFAGLSSSTDYISIKYRGSLRIADKKESSALASASSITDLTLPPHADDKYTVYLTSLPAASNIKLPYINKHRQMFLQLPADISKISNVMPLLREICDQVFRPAALSRSFQVVHGAPLNDKELLRSLKFDSSYTILFSLLVPEPDSVMASWDMSTAVREYLSDFESTVKQYVDLKIKSQVLYYETLAMKPKKHQNGEYKFLTPKEMPHLINPIEARLSSFVDTNPTINFIVYVPTASQYPLYLHNHKGERTSGNSFLVPRWGGFYIHNVNTTSDTYPIKHEIDMGSVLSELLPQAKSLLGFSELSDGGVINRSPAVDSSLSSWELDQWMRQKTIENIGSSTHALYSLSNLVQNIRNMVINDDISKQVTQSVEAILSSYDHLSRGDIELAFRASKQALQSAEKAFFDTSLLELLYFPEDQKFAIYIPLFLPIGLPLIGSTIAAIKWFKGAKPKNEPTAAKETTSEDKPKSD